MPSGPGRMLASSIALDMVEKAIQLGDVGVVPVLPGLVPFSSNSMDGGTGAGSNGTNRFDRTYRYWARQYTLDKRANYPEKEMPY